MASEGAMSYTRGVTRDEVAAAVAEAFGALAREAIAGGRRFVCAVPGGSVATTVFPALARLRVPWPEVDILLADERLVPPDHPDANQRAVREHWLAHIEGPPPAFHPMPTVGVGAEEAARLAGAALCGIAGTPPRIDLAILGVGPDGHVASLFPERPAWRESPAWVIAVDDAPKPPARRLSLGLPALAAARQIWFVAFGHEKAAAVAEAQRVPRSPLPVAVVARSGPRVRWFLDAGANAP
jgi:6-phosphogluconolactonase